MAEAMESLWHIIREEVKGRVADEPELSDFLADAVLRWKDWHAALAHGLARRLGSSCEDFKLLHGLIERALRQDSNIGIAAAQDVRAVLERDPACHEFHVPFLFSKGFHALQIHRAAHCHWRNGRRTSAYLLQHRCNESLAVDIHPAVPMGMGIMLDHGTGFVAGETAVIEDDVSLLHGVTLGSTGKHAGDRHPKVRQGATIGAGANVLGNIEIGAGSRIGAGCVVLESVPCAQTAVGSRARVVRRHARLGERAAHEHFVLIDNP